MRRELLHGDDIFVIHDFLTLEECERFIAASETVGFEDAPITTSGPITAFPSPFQRARVSSAGQWWRTRHDDRTR